jgi:hypothetical protein
MELPPESEHLSPPPPPYANFARGEGRFDAFPGIQFDGGNITFGLQQDVNDLPVLSGRKQRDWADNGSSWVALLWISCKDIFTTMKQGLYFSQENIDPLRSRLFIGTNSTAYLKKQGYSHMREYFLIDLAEDPQWYGSLKVFTRGLNDLSEFRIYDMTIDHIVIANGFDKNESHIYQYNRWYPQKNINIIYDDMPLMGWWPWPRAPLSRTGPR